MYVCRYNGNPSVCQHFAADAATCNKLAGLVEMGSYLVPF